MTAFSKNLRKLREDKKISQKSAAATLGVSQALLSHYEKGIRECGLDFLARAAKYYGVSTDFMLGLSVEQTAGSFGGDISSKLNDGKIKKDENMYSVLYKNLIIRAVNYIFDNMRDIKYHDASVLSGKYLSLAIYRLCGLLYAGIEKPENLSENYLISELKYITDIKNLDEPLGQYNFDCPYINNIIKNAEPE